MFVDASRLINKASFPFEIFKPAIADSFHKLAEQKSIPLDYMGTAALFTISALSGNMYTTELNGEIKNILYCMLIGDSGLGKTPAFNHLCMNIVQYEHQERYFDYREALKKWKTDQRNAMNKKHDFNVPQPSFHHRISSGGTMEGLMGNAMRSRCGFGMYYDEGSKMMNSPNAYKKDTGSSDFWNEVWNGNPFVDLRANEEDTRLIPATSISTLIGMQSDRVEKIFTKDNIQSGLSSRFLITQSDHFNLNEHVDHFDRNKNKVSPHWEETVLTLFKRGYHFSKDTVPYCIPFTNGAKEAYNALSNKLIKESNINSSSVVYGDHTKIMQSYDSKLYQYVGRFCSILSIMGDYNSPVINETCVEQAELLYRYYRSQAERLFRKISGEINGDLTMNERNLLDLLPDEFTTRQAHEACEKLKLSHSFFDMVYIRKYKKDYLKRKEKGIYVKF